jgi:hypothetical protein
MWKTFMVTDINRIERVSGAIHAKLESNGPTIGQFEFPLPGDKKEGEKAKPDSKSENLKGREVFLRPVLSAPLGIKTPPAPLPSRVENVLLQLNAPNPISNKPGMIISKLEGLNEPKEKED